MPRMPEELVISDGRRFSPSATERKSAQRFKAGEIVSGCVLVWKKNLMLSPAMTRFIEHIREWLEQSCKTGISED